MELHKTSSVFVQVDVKGCTVFVKVRLRAFLSVNSVYKWHSGCIVTLLVVYLALFKQRRHYMHWGLEGLAT